jgi:putative oxidoreductase
MSYSRSDWGRLLLRVTIGGMMLFHGIDKLRHGITGIKELVVAKGLPEALAYGVYAGEVVAPLMLIFGVFTTIAALVLAFNMVVAIYTAHSADVFAIGEHGNWLIELPMFYLLGAIAILLLGPGEIAFRGSGKRRP